MTPKVKVHTKIDFGKAAADVKNYESVTQKSKIQSGLKKNISSNKQSTPCNFTKNDVLRKSASNVGGPKMGLRMQGGGDMDEINSPPKTEARKQPVNTAVMSSGGGVKKRGMTLTSYTQMRNILKSNRTDTSDISIDTANSKSLAEPPHRNKPTLGSNLTQLRERHKREKEKFEHLEREKDLFGDLEEIKSMRNTLQPPSRRDGNNHSITNSHRSKNQFNATQSHLLAQLVPLMNEDSDECPFSPEKQHDYDVDVEIDAFDDINEREGVPNVAIPGQPVDGGSHSGNSHNLNSNKSSMISRHSFYMADNDLPTINEMDDQQASPAKALMKVPKKVRHSEIATPKNSSGTNKTHHFGAYRGSGSNAGGSNEKSMIKRRNTEALKQPSKLSSPTSKPVQKIRAADVPQKKSINQPHSSNITGSGMSTKANTGMLKKPGSKIEYKAAAPAKKVVRFGLKKPSTGVKSTGLKAPSLKPQSKLGIKKPSNPVSPHHSVKKIPYMAISEKHDPKQPKPVEDKTKEKHRKMLAERKLLLKQKMAAIKIQKYWKIRARRRQLRFQKLKYDVSIRRIQRWFRQIYHLIKAKSDALRVGEQNLDKVVMIQKNYIRYSTSPKKINVAKFKSSLAATIKGWKVRRVLEVLKSQPETREAVDTITMYEEAKTKPEDPFFKNFYEKFPQMVELFHEKYSEMINDPKWPERPINHAKILVSF